MRQLKISSQITRRETISFNKYLQEVSSIPMLTKEEEEALPAKIKAGDEKATKRFIEGNLRFVISVAKQYQGPREKIDDLINAGNEGLIVAVKKFDSSRGFKFISYAVWWIRQSIMQHLTENSKGIRLPANKIFVIKKIKDITSSLEQQLQRSPTYDEIKNEFFRTVENREAKLDSSSIEQLMAIGSPISSIDMKVSDDSESSLSDLLPSNSFDDGFTVIAQQDLKKTLQILINKKLTPRERNVIIMSFGLFGESQRTLDEIGDGMSLTRERVRQIKIQALKKLKFSSMLKEIKEYF